MGPLNSLNCMQTGIFFAKLHSPSAVLHLASVSVIYGQIAQLIVCNR